MSIPPLCPPHLGLFFVHAVYTPYWQNYGLVFGVDRGMAMIPGDWAGHNRVPRGSAEVTRHVAWSWACLQPASDKGSATEEPLAQKCLTASTAGRGPTACPCQQLVHSLRDACSADQVGWFTAICGSGKVPFTRKLSTVGVGLGLGYAKALHARLGAGSPHRQPPGKPQRRLPAFSRFSGRRT